MKNLVIKFTLFWLAIFSISFALTMEEYQFIRHENVDGVNYIHLNKDLTFVWNPLKYERKMISDWKENDVIDLDLNEKRVGEFILVNHASAVFYAAQVSLTEESVAKLPTITQIDFMFFPFNSLKKVTFIFTLSNGTIATDDIYSDKYLDYYDHWKVGDRVLTLLEEFDSEGEIIRNLFVINYDLSLTDDRDNSMTSWRLD